MTPKPDLGSIVASLRADAGTGGAIVRRLVDPSIPVKVYLGVDPEGAQLGVILSVHRRLIPAPMDLPGGAGFEVRPLVMKDDPKDTVILGVFCTDAASEDIFRHFMDDLIMHLITATSADAATRTFLARVGLWQRFFVAGSGNYLSEEAQCGLFAELLMLRDVILPAVGASAAVDGWKGPEGKPQDFVLPGGALEVKCTRAKAGGKIPIASEQQLDERPFPHLALAHVAVTLGGSGNPALADIIDGIRGLLAGSGRPLDVFNDRLILAGWIDAHAARYSETRFFVREVHFFDVRDGFPRIRQGDFPPGVVDITYRLDPAALMPFEVERAAVEDWLKQ
jgi:hypothetical protein